MATQKLGGKRKFRVIDSMDAPVRGRVIRLRLSEGRPPTVGELKGARLTARSPGGEEETLLVLGFAIVGGKPSNGRLSRTGRADLVVTLEGNQERPTVRTGWEIVGP